MAKKKDNNNFLLIGVAVVLVVLLYQNGAFQSFVTTCTNIEPATVPDFKLFMNNALHANRTSVEETINGSFKDGNETISIILTGAIYSNGNYIYAVVDTAQTPCGEFVRYVLKNEEQKINSTFVSRVVALDYDPANNDYFTLVNGAYEGLDSTPRPGEVYYKNNSDGTYTQMPVPYMTTAPTLADNPYDIYTPMNYKDIDAYLVDGVLFWCSKSNKVLLASPEKYYESLVAYGQATTVCETKYINDTAKLVERCEADLGVWVPGVWTNDAETTPGHCSCPDGKAYAPNVECGQEVAGDGSESGTASTSNEDGIITALPSGSKTTTKFSPVKIAIAGLIALGIFGYMVYTKKFVKKRKK